jgi:hypothetical protein
MKKITIKDLHELNNKYPQLKNMHLSHQYDTKTESWKFVGYKCSICSTTFKREGFIERHVEACKPKLKLNRDPEQQINLKNVGKPFT